MEVARFIVGGILPYVTVVVFVAAMSYRIFVWKKLPMPKMTLFPAPETYGKRFTGVLRETFLFERLFNADKSLWLFAMMFHVVLAITFLDHYDRLLAYTGMTDGAIFLIPFVSGGPTGIVILICVLILLVRRLAVRRVAEISSFADFFALLLVFAIVLTGDALRFLTHLDMVRMREYFAGLLTFSFKPLPENNWFLIHYLLGQILIIYIPFSKLLHLGGIFFTQAALHRH